MNGYIGALKLYGVFDGRTNSADYWRFTLVNMVIWMGLCGFDLITGFSLPDSGISLTGFLYDLSGLGDQASVLTAMYQVGNPLIQVGSSGGSGLFGSLYDWLTLIPVYAITVRRLHDSGRTGWWALLNAIPLLGSMILLFFMLAASDPNENEHTISTSDRNRR